MAFQDLKFRLPGEVPGLPAPLSPTLINEALDLIYDSQMWSFQIKEAGWYTPGLLFGTTTSAGTITTVINSNQIVGDAIAAAAWVAYAGFPLLTQFQIRVMPYSLYSIIAFDGVNTLTIDRPWMEPAAVGQSYMIYQAYFTAPVLDFNRFFSVRDTTNGNPLNYWSYSQRDLAARDPQRTNFNQPCHVVPYQWDARVGSATLGWMMYELWPHPLTRMPYTLVYLRRGPALVLPTDTVSPPLTEELVMWRAKEVAYLWKEAARGDGLSRASGPDWQFLADRKSVV
jgi:hypothetical protein